MSTKPIKAGSPWLAVRVFPALPAVAVAAALVGAAAVAAAAVVGQHQLVLGPTDHPSQSAPRQLGQLV